MAAQYLAELLDDTCQVEVVGSAVESEASMRLCAELWPDAVFVDILPRLLRPAHAEAVKDESQPKISG